MFAGSARAQETLVAKIPFPFVVRGAELPAGQYDIVNVDGVIRIEGTDIRSAAIALATPAGGQDPKGREPSLVFINSDGRYTLSQIWESDTEGLQLAGRTARGRHVAALPPAPEPPTVVAAEYAK
jgi:hypothetical protein